MLPRHAEILAKVIVEASCALDQLQRRNRSAVMDNVAGCDVGDRPNPRAELQVQAPAAMTVEVAHEIRELLTILVFSLEQLKRQPLDDRGRTQLTRAAQAAGQIGEIVKRVQPI
jgi:signal transduction histidine kinase